MGKIETPGSSIIKAAGGLLWRSHRESWQIAIIYRPRYDDWTLPKGKIKNNETWQQAALREVKEETGFSAKIIGFAGAVSYVTNQGPKVVRFWNMMVIEKVDELDGDEVSEVAWLSRDEALEKLQYHLDRALLDAWLGPGKAVED